MGPIRSYIFLFLSLILLNACSGVSMLQKGKAEDYYTEEFLTQIESIKDDYGLGKSDLAIKRLQAMSEAELLPSERSLRRNLIGVILFSKENFEQAIYNFDLALTNSRLDRALTAQIYLNLASSYYRLGFEEKTYSTLSLAEFKFLQPLEAKKFHLLRFRVAGELNRPKTELVSLIWYLSDKESVSDLRADTYFSRLIDNFFSLQSRERIRILNEFESEEIFNVGYLAYLSAEKLYYEGERDDVDPLLKWVSRRFEKNQELMDLVSSFTFRTESFSQMDQSKIGIVLPLSGEKEVFGSRVLRGIDAGIQQFGIKADVETNSKTSKYELLVRDSEGVGAVGAHHVRDLIENHNVSIIIGGLFSDEASKEYLEARKYGVIFISLSEIYLPKDQKNHLLLEIPGSVESQMAEMFSPEMLNTLGNRGALLYPKTERGEAIVEEFWRKSTQNKVELAGVHSYQPEQTDLRDPVQNLLGLKFTRARKEEFDMLTEVYSLEGKRSARRVQVLKPQVDFDWVFIASYPQEALQLLPSFGYFDAYNLNLIGGPSWRSQSLSAETSRLGSLLFIGDDVTSEASQFSKFYFEQYKQRPRIIEMRAFDSISLADKLLGKKEFKSRNELELFFRNMEKVSGITGDWALEDDVWLKDMKPFKMSRGKILPFTQNAILEDTKVVEVEEQTL